MKLLACLVLSLCAAGCGEGRASAPHSPTEIQLAETVRTELRDEAALAQVDADVLDGTVVLTGQVATDRDRDAATELVERIPGVDRVQNDLTVSGDVSSDVTTPRVDTTPDAGGTDDGE